MSLTRGDALADSRAVGGLHPRRRGPPHDRLAARAGREDLL